MTLNRVVDCNYYSFVDGILNFMYYPESYFVKCANLNSTYRAIAHFSRRGFEIDWIKSHIGQNRLYISVPDHLSEEESLSLIGTTTEELYAQSVEDKVKTRDKVISNNVDNTTGKVIKEQYLIDTIGRLNNIKGKSREDIANWYNRYNLEVARPDIPIIICSTKSKKTIIEEGKKLIWSLFERGDLRKLTKEEYLAKISGK